MDYGDDTTEALFLRGDAAATRLVVRWVAQVLSLPGFWRIRDQWLDLHQEVMLRVIASLRQGRFDPTRDFRTYVQGVARYTGLEALREKRLDGPVQDDLATSDPWGRHDRQLHAVQRVRIALEGVSDGCRDLLRSHFLEEKSHAEIASALGIPIGTVKSRIARCLKGLQRFLTRGGMEQAGA